jgi:hypothetical protein
MKNYLLIIKYLLLMPNWCENELTITGTKKDIEQFYLDNKNGEEELDFYKSIPMPDNIYNGNLGQNERKLHGKNNWYDWNCENIGTKWNVRDAHYEFIEKIDKNSAFNTIKTIYLKTKEKDTVLQAGTVIKKFFVTYNGVYNFDTAWSPPLKWMETIAEKYKNLKFKLSFCESGCDFAGYQIYENGIEIEDCIESAAENNYQKNKDVIRNEIQTIIENNYLNINEKADFDKLQEKLQEEYYYFEDDFLEYILRDIN